MQFLNELEKDWVMSPDGIIQSLEDGGMLQGVWTKRNQQSVIGWVTLRNASFKSKSTLQTGNKGVL